MNFVAFLEYVAKFTSGQLFSDQTYKYYDLLWEATNKRLRRALADCGFTHSELSVSLAECATRVRERGYEGMSETTVQQCLLEWYVWRRLEQGVYRKWKYHDQTHSKRRCRVSKRSPMDPQENGTASV